MRSEAIPTRAPRPEPHAPAQERVLAVGRRIDGSLPAHGRSPGGWLDEALMRVCARDEHTSASHRIQASFDCVRYGLDADRHDIAEDGHRRLIALTPVTPDDRQYHCLGQIYYQAALGSQFRALEIAREWMAYERERGDPYRLAWSARLVGFSAGLTGDLIEARRAQLESLGIARESRLWLAMYIAHDILIGLAVDYESPRVLRQTVESSWLECEAIVEHLPRMAASFALQRAILAVEEGDAAAALRQLPVTQVLAGFPVTRSHYLAVQLAAHMLSATSNDVTPEMQALADELALGFVRPADGLGWGGGVYAEFLERYQGSEAADDFVRGFLGVMRELKPPRRLAPFVARLRGTAVDAYPAAIPVAAAPLV